MDGASRAPRSYLSAPGREHDRAGPAGGAPSGGADSRISACSAQEVAEGGHGEGYRPGRIGDPDNRSDLVTLRFVGDRNSFVTIAQVAGPADIRLCRIAVDQRAS
jgi:hypothetical protein